MISKRLTPAQQAEARERIAEARANKKGQLSDSHADKKTPAHKTRVRQPRLRTMTGIAPEKILWLWDGRIPLGALTILDGDPGLGKSTITADLAARVSRGGTMPPLSGRTDLDGAAGVLLLSAEDSPEQTIRPRLDAAGADLSRVHILDAVQLGDADERPPVLPADLDLIAEIVREHRIRLIVIDPIMAFLDGDLDAHRDQDVRRVLHRLKMLAEATGCAVLLIRHLNKLTGGPALYRGGGSIGISGAARSVMIVGKNPADPRQLVLAATKCNLCAMPAALTYSVETADNGVSMIGWGEETTLGADDILGHRAQRASVADQCAEALADALADGPRPAKEVEEEIRANGFGPNAIRDARKKLKVRASKDGFEGGWMWRLPGVDGPGGEGDEVTIPPGW